MKLSLFPPVREERPDFSDNLERTDLSDDEKINIIVVVSGSIAFLVDLVCLAIWDFSSPPDLYRSLQEHGFVVRTGQWPSGKATKGGGKPAGVGPPRLAHARVVASRVSWAISKKNMVLWRYRAGWRKDWERFKASLEFSDDDMDDEEEEKGKICWTGDVIRTLFTRQSA
jgi:hypothetical protein